MNEKEKAKRLQEEVRRAAGWAKATKGTSFELAFEAYAEGIQYAIDLLVGKEPKSALP